ncbi:Hypothetical predicted protein [Octopus vulgaris]|uniref:Reverse transcriptase domain-containing protein n=1 Tax=Octopus vulgaris TaxID=6645 RepID=A0AA36BXJ7_OCTVU|nr:Hypothetical predicted protein [Octopus vulgaris]
MRLALEKQQDSGFTVGLSKRVKTKKISDAEFADDIFLLANTVSEIEELMQEVETMSMSVALKMNEIKAKNLVENIKKPEKIMNVDRKPLELVEDFLYLGAKTGNTEGDIVEKKSKAWVACHSFRSVWKSDLCKDLKICVFVAAVEPALLCGTWTLTKKLTQMVDGCYTRMLRMVLIINQ